MLVFAEIVVVSIIIYRRKKNKTYAIKEVKTDSNTESRRRFTREELEGVTTGDGSNDEPSIALESGIPKPRATQGYAPVARGKKFGVSFHAEATEVAYDTQAAPSSSLIIKVKKSSRANAQSLGHRVDVVGYGLGVLEYYGPHATKLGYRCGVHLDRPVGHNNGTVDGFQYFECPEKHGILVRALDYLCTVLANFSSSCYLVRYP